VDKNWNTKKIYSLAKREVNLFYKDESTFEFLVMSGAHAEEPAGNWAIEEIKNGTSHFKNLINRFCLIPYRNPFSKDFIPPKGFRILVLNSDFCIKINEEEKLLLVDIKKEVEGIDASDWWKTLRNSLMDTMKSKEGDIYYLLIPNITQDIKGSYNAFLFFDGEILDFNSGFGAISAPHLDPLIETIQHYKPKLIIDLHEGLGEGFYVYINPKKPAALNFARDIIHFMKEKNYKIKNDNSYREILEEGIFDITSINKKGSLESLINDDQTLIILESGIGQEKGKRVQAHLDAIAIAVNRYNFN
jgi:hypothetical protein